MSIPAQFSRSAVPTFDDLPLDDPVGATRLVIADGKTYHNIWGNSILRSQKWAVLGATRVPLGNEEEEEPPPELNPPINTVAPVVTGDPWEASNLNTDDGTWSPDGTKTYKWQVSDNGTTGWADIGGADSATYEVAGAHIGKYLRSLVRATNNDGFAEKESNVVGPVIGIPVNTVAPVASGGPQVDVESTATAGTWDPDGTKSYLWRLSPDGVGDWEDTASTTNAITPDAGMESKYLKCVVTATSDAGATPADSNVLGPIGAA